MLIHLSLSLSVSLDRISLCPGYLLSAYLSPHFFLACFFYLSTDPSIYLSIYLAIYLSIYLCTNEQTLISDQIQTNKVDGCVSRSTIDWDHLKGMGILTKSGVCMFLCLGNPVNMQTLMWNDQRERVKKILHRYRAVIISADENMYECLVLN